MVFVELSPFIAFREKHWNDDDFHRLQLALLQTPKAGDVIRSSGGLRKVRWTAQGRGKRGGSRVIYYFQDSEDRIYLVYGYTKNESEDLTPEQIRVLANIVKGTVDG
jgi:mRNA-degrading endonuclease RelE of RelBE toxin-antitoxin system